MTEKLYYQDSHLHTFTAVVQSCTPHKDGFAVQLDRTAFFPEGGGQPADTGMLSGVSVTDVQEKDGCILHYTTAPLSPGEAVTGVLDWAQRFRRMQGHSGEHIVSGIAHTLYGCTNVGFHMGTDEITIDFDRELSLEQLAELELAANRVVYENRAITTQFPAPEALPNLNYRSKLELTEDVRLVIIDGCDVCACCAPHVSRTGEVGVIRLLDAMRHRGGVRLRLLCGEDAYLDYRLKSMHVAAISAALSAKQTETPAAVTRLQNELSEAKQTILQLKLALAARKRASITPSEGNICIFDDVLDGTTLRELVNDVLPLCGGICAAFSGTDETGYRYSMASRTQDMRAAAREINTALTGRGGGTPEMIQGSVSATKAEILAYFKPEQLQ